MSNLVTLELVTLVMSCDLNKLYGDDRTIYRLSKLHLISVFFLLF